MSDLHNWSSTDGSNNGAIPGGFPNGALPGAVKNWAQAVMGSLKREFDQRGFTLTSGGTTSAFTLTPSPAIDGYATGQCFGFIANNAPAASATFNVNTKGAKTFKKRTPGGLASLAGGEWASGDYIECVYNGTDVVITNILVAKEVIVIAVGSESAAITTGTAKITFRMPFAMTVTAVRGSLTTAQASGSIFTVDINESGTTILSTKLTIDNTEKTSTTAATPAVISDAALADDAEITIDIDQVGNGTAAGLKVYLIGYRA